MMQATSRRLVFRARTISQCRFSQSSRQVARTRSQPQWQRQFSIGHRFLAEDDKKPSINSTTETSAPGKVKALTNDDDFKVLTRDAVAGEGKEHKVTNVDDGVQSLEDFQAEHDISDDEMGRLMHKYPGIDMEMIERLKTGKLRESQLPKLLKQKYPDGPPEAVVDKGSISALTDLEDYTELVEKLDNGTLSPEEKVLLQSLHAKVMQDPEIRQTMMEGVIEDDGVTDDVESSEPTPSQLRALENMQQVGHVPSKQRKSAVLVEQDAAEDIEASDEDVQLQDMAKLNETILDAVDEEMLEELTEEERELFEQIKHDPELMQMLQTESMVDFAEQLTSGQFSAEFLMGLSEEERAGLEQMRNDPDFVQAISAIPARLQEKLSADPALVERARKLGEKLGLKSQNDMLLSMPEYENLLGEIEEEGRNDRDEEELDEEEDSELDNLSVEELEERLAEARKDPEFRKFEQEMEAELEQKFGSEHPQLSNIKKRMLRHHQLQYAKAKASGLSGQSTKTQSINAVYGKAGNPVRNAYEQGRASVLEKEIDLYQENPSILFEYMEELEEMRTSFEERYDEDNEFAMRTDQHDKDTTTQADKQVEAFWESIDEREDLGIVEEPDNDYVAVEDQSGFWNYGEDPAEEWGDDEKFDSDDIGALAHADLELQREIRQYARFSTWELPLLYKLAKKPYYPPMVTATPLRFRYTTYLGESHPASKKVVLEVDPRNLPLSEEERETLCKLAGTRYNPARNMIKMSCESFETQAQNKRYLGDLIETLINEAKTGADKYADVPLDVRHVKRRAKPKFPEEWRFTEDRRIELQNQRAQLAEREKQRLTGGGVVDGLGVIQQALRRKALEAQRETVAVPAAPRRRLA